MLVVIGMKSLIGLHDYHDYSRSCVSAIIMRSLASFVISCLKMM